VKEMNRVVSTGRFQRGYWPYLCIGLFVFLLYAKCLWFDFTYLDDNALILNNHGILSNPANFFRLFKLGHFISYTDAYYRPLVDASYMLDTILGRGRYFMYHLTNIIIHIFATALLYIFLIRLKVQRRFAFYFSLAFAVHPALTQAVCWVPGRNDSMLGVFVLLSFIFFMNFSESRKLKDYLIHLFFFGLALLTKETALVLPLLYFFFTPFPQRKIFLLSFGYGAVILVWFLLRQAALPGQSGIMSFVVLKCFFKNLPALIQYIGKALLPFNLSVLPIIQDTSFIWGIMAITLICVGLVISKAIASRRVLFGGFCFFLFLAPAFFIPYPSNVTHFYEHRLYLPLVGLIIILCEIAQRLKVKKEAFVVFSSLIIVIFSFAAFNRQDVFKDRMSFWQSAVKTSPHSPLVHRNLGAMYYLDGRLNEAELEYKEALRINPYEPMANNNLGLIFMQKGQLDKAEQAFLRELSFNPDYDDANYNLGLLYHKLGRKEEASRLWEKAVKINPNHKQAVECLGKVRLRKSYRDGGYEEMAK